MAFSGMPDGVPFGPDWQLKALIARHGYGNVVVSDVATLLERFYDELANRLLDSGLTSAAEKERLDQLMRWAQSRLAEVQGTARFSVGQQLQQYGAAEAQVMHAQAQTLRAVLGVPGRAQLIQAARFADIVATVDIGGIKLGAWWERDAQSALMRARSTIQSGLLQGMGPREVSRLVIARDPGIKTLFRTQVHGVRAAVRTAMTAVSTEAATLEHREMADVMLVVRWESVIDVRTSDICAGLDGRTWEVSDTTHPKPPAHVNCRSALVPVPDLSVIGVTQDTLGRRVSYDEWLRAQSAAVQNDVLGNAKAELYRKGDVTLAQMIGTDGRRVSLDQLIARLS